MKPPTCPKHGRAEFANAGAPYLVRCNGESSCGLVLERCPQCRAEGCSKCEERGWIKARGEMGYARVR